MFLKLLDVLGGQCWRSSNFTQGTVHFEVFFPRYNYNDKMCVFFTIKESTLNTLQQLHF